MRKLFTFMFAIVASMNFFAECVPSIPAPQNGYVTFVIRIPIGTECNGIAFKGTLDGNNWTGSDQYLGENGVGARYNCIKFEPIEGYQGWFKATYKLGNEFVSRGVTARMMGKICLIYTGDGSWEGQALSYDFLEDYCTASHSISSVGDIQIHSSGLIYIHIALWQKSECHTTIIKQRTVTVTFPECGFETPSIRGSFDNWTGTPMNQLSGYTYMTTILASDLDEFIFASAEQGYDNQLCADREQVRGRFCGDTIITLNLSQNTHWDQCTEGNSGAYDYKITFKAFDYNLRTLYLQNGESIVAPTPPVFDGLEFLGWDQTFNYANSSMVINAIYKDVGFTGFVNCDIFSCNYIFDAQKGSVDGPTEARIDSSNIDSSNITCTAIPNRGYQFISWSDGNTDNPRTIELTQDTTMEAIFDYLLEGKCGKDNVLSWKFDPSTMALEITGKGALSENYTYGTFIESLTIGNEVNTIGQSAFKGCTNLKNVILGSSVKVLEEYAFYGCPAIETITCYSQRPPTVNQNALYGLDYSTIVYVPADYLDTYKMHDTWGLYDVRPIGSTSVQTTDLQIMPAENAAEVVWPAVENAATYELVIKDKEGNVICTLVFNANGQLTQIAFSAPSRTPQQTQGTGFSFTVTGLEQGTEYNLTITAKDNNGATLDEKSMAFHTDWPESIDEDVHGNDTHCTKVVRGGKVFIRRGEKVYTLQGQEVR